MEIKEQAKMKRTIRKIQLKDGTVIPSDTRGYMVKKNGREYFKPVNSEFGLKVTAFDVTSI